MRRLANGLFVLVICAAGMLVAATEAAATSRHLRKHPHRQVQHFTNTWYPGWSHPAAAPFSPGEDVCPGNARSFDCKVWPPPFDQDPDRKAAGADAGG